MDSRPWAKLAVTVLFSYRFGSEKTGDIHLFLRNSAQIRGLVSFYMVL